jgi:hypothetical protein
MSYINNPSAGGGGGSGTVTSVAGGVGITNTPEPITVTGTVDLDINSLSTETGLAVGDLFPFVDVSVGLTPAAQRKVDLASLADFVRTSEGLIDGSGVANRLAFWSDADTLTSDASYVVDTAADALLIRRIVEAIGDGADSNLIARSFGTTFMPNIRGISARGTEALPTATGADDDLLHLRGSGHDGTTADRFGAAIRLRADEAWTPTATGSYISFTTIADGTLTQLERVRIDHNGFVGIGTTNPSVALDIEMTDATAVAARVSNLGTGDAALFFDVGGTDWYIAIDNSVADSLVFGIGASVGTGNRVAINPTSGGQMTVSQLNTIRMNGSPTALLQLAAGATGSAFLFLDAILTTEDPFVAWSTSITNWSAGIDNSDSDIWKLDNSGAPGGATRLQVTTGDVVSIPTGQLAVGATDVAAPGIAKIYAAGTTATTAEIRVDNTSTGDARLQVNSLAADALLFLNTASFGWHIGADTSDLTKLKVGRGTDVALLNILELDESTTPDRVSVFGDLVVTGTVYGGTAASDVLVLQGTLDTTDGFIDVRDPMYLWTNVVGGDIPTTLPAGAPLHFDAAITSSAATSVLSVLDTNYTWTQTAAIVLATHSIFRAGGTYNVQAGTVFPALVAMADVTTYVADGTNITGGTLLSFTASPTITRTGASTATGFLYTGYDTRPVYATGVTADLRRGLHYQEAGGTGTTTTGIAVDVADLTKTTNPRSLRSVGSSVLMLHTGNVRLGDQTVPTEKLEVLGNLLIDNGGTAGELRLREPSGGGSSYTGFKAPALGGNLLYTLPATDGSAGDVLSTNGSAVLSWTPVAGATTYITRINGSSGAAGTHLTWQNLTADSSDITTTTLTTVMSTTDVGAGTWKFKYTLICQSAATGTGLGFGINHTGTTGQFQAILWSVTTGGAAATGVLDDDTATVAGQLVEGKHEGVLNVGIGSFFAGVATANADVTICMEGIIVVTSSGTLELKVSSENIGTAVRVMADSCLELCKIE